MVFSDFHALLKGDCRRTDIIIVDLQRIKQKQHIPGQQHHPLTDPGRDRTHADHEFIEKRRAASIWQLVWHRREQFPQCGILRHTLAVTTGVDDQNAQLPEVSLLLMEIL